MTSPTVFHPFTCIKPLPWLTGLGPALALVQSRFTPRALKSAAVLHRRWAADPRRMCLPVSAAGRQPVAGPGVDHAARRHPKSGHHRLRPRCPTGSGWWHWV